MEPPECPVCLQSYDGACTVPRVLACGHTACEDCLTNLPKKFPHTISCPACTVLVKFPSQGPSALPKNIDLLRLFPSSRQNYLKPSRNCENFVDFVPRSWSDDFYTIWKDRVLPYDAISVEDGQNDDGDSASSSLLFGCLRDEQRLSLLRVASFQHEETGSVFKYSYVRKMMECLFGMREEARYELDVILSAKQRGVCRVFGLWGNLEDGLLYLVGEKLSGFCLDEFDNLLEDNIPCFAVIGMQICETIFSLQKEGVITGCLSFSCVKFDGFGNAYVDLIELLEAGRNVNRLVLEEASQCSKPIGLIEMGAIIRGLLKKGTFLSPEVLFELLKKQKIVIASASSKYLVSYSSDVWPLCFVLLNFLFGKHFTDELFESVDCVDTKGNGEELEDFLALHTGLTEKIRFLLESKLEGKFESLCKTLCRCCSLDLHARPVVSDLWRCIRELIINSRFISMIGFDSTTSDKVKDSCLVIGELSQMIKKRSSELERDDLTGAENGRGANESEADTDFVGRLSEGNIKSKDMHGHLDCVTGLAIGGGFLFSSSFDRNIHVWSLQDYSLVHTFKGHEDKVMALVYINGEEPLCVSGDSGGGIFVWSISLPLRQEPLRKWCEPKDWRYSGIHALTFAEDGYLYSGSGDKTIKAWSLQDGKLVCTMSSHKSVVSALVVKNSVLYSGSWDGTVQLWSLSDHSLLAVLGEETPGTIRSILSLAADKQIFVAAHESGTVKVWKDDSFVKSIQIQSGAILSIALDGKWLFTGGIDGR
ncbi:PREDICTED: uncharacterized protein LOC104813679 isoform X2 [Tarenaya hassleriana]|uniref:uncharacterized protein LOC104813679 isoform X2 n=1 Tax=Tarenaya hassleriana TaxID=28532 RepID=UPI00053C97C3|nr:PREDICTED: uncharacterized protein LOC104813679 isoform X2 [Tarenaya hassleriana]